MGIDVIAPRLSWRLDSHDRDQQGFSQRSYHILVASSLALLRDGNGDLWDSGTISSNQSTQITYLGKHLTSGKECWWKVQVTDEHSKPLPWSQPAKWSMGLLARNEWHGHWIGAERSSKTGAILPDPWFRKDVELAKTPSRAIVHLASIGYHELYVNGQKVGDAVLAPSVSDLSQRARYRTYDLCKYLHRGKNTIGVWLGSGWSTYNHFPAINRTAQPQQPLFILQGSIQASDRTSIPIESDETWKTHESSSRLLGTWDFMNYGGEEIDGRKEIPDWGLPTLDDSDWVSSSIYHPKVLLSSEMVEPNKTEHLLNAQSVEWVSEGWRVDLGRNFTGWIELNVHGEPGTRVEMDFSERKEAEITHQLHSAYIIGPSGKGVFRNRFNYSVGRWVTIKGLDYQPAKTDIKGWLVRTDYERASQFNCSNDLLNWIYDTSLWTFECLTVGGYTVDCPQRERMGYGGDAHATTQLGLNNYKLGAFYTKWAQDWRDTQSPDGNLPYTAPTYWGGGGPVWSSYIIFLPWKMYEWNGDKRLLSDQYANMKRFLAFEEAKSKENLLVRWGGEWDFLGDWLWPRANGVNGDTPETLFLNNAYWAYALKTVARTAKILGHDADANYYETRSRQVASAVHKRFFNSRTSDYVSGDQQYIAAALLANIPPYSVRTKVWKRLEGEILVHRKGHIWAGITGGALLTRLLLENHRADLLYQMAIQPDYPGWGEFRRIGMTTIPEDWESSLSLTHSSYLYIGALFVEGILGIHPDRQFSGFQQFVIEPMLDSKPGLTNASGQFDSPYGTIRCAWRGHDKTCDVDITIPPNSSALFRIPLNYHLKPGSGHRQDPIQRLLPGNYHFSLTKAETSMVSASGKR